MSHTAEKNHAAETAAAQKAAAEEKAKAEAKEKAATVSHPDWLLAAMATDYLIGDKHNYALIRQQAINLLTSLGVDGAEAKARIEGMTGNVPTNPVPHGPTVTPHEAKAGANAKP
jgi:hypothetical protein